MRGIVFISLLAIFAISEGKTDSTLPNIIFFLADDLGFNDVGYHNPEVITPNIDSLAASGVILDKNYVQTVCTPSRSALLTGIYPYKIGRQGKRPLGAAIPTGLTLERTLLPEYLKVAGYSNHLIGKWHLGHCKPEYTPLRRGFESAFGYWGGGIDYYTKKAGNHRDFHFNNDPFSDPGNYSMDMYAQRMRGVIQNHDKSSPLFLYLPMQNVHTPYQVPQKYIDMYPEDISENKDRRTLLGMVTKMDEVLGEVIEELKANDLYDNSILIFSSDNGGMIGKGHKIEGPASNFPLKGGKGTYYEGGFRVPAFVHSPKYVKNPGRVYENLFHITDWLPTLLNIAQIVTIDSFDGFDHFNAIFNNNEDEIPRLSVVNDLSHTKIQGEDGLSGAIQIEGGWKLLRNPLRTSLKDTFYLYNVQDDPEESIELSSSHPEMLEKMKTLFDELVQDMVPEDLPSSLPNDQIVDENGNLITGWC